MREHINDEKLFEFVFFLLNEWNSLCKIWKETKTERVNLDEKLEA